MSGEQLSFIAPTLPQAFEARWRELERKHGIQRAGLACLESDEGESGSYVAFRVRVDGRAWSLLRRCDDTSMHAAADDVWTWSGRCT